MLEVVPQPKFQGNGLKILEKRYLLPGETPTDLVHRVSWGNEDYYHMIANLDFLPNSPTLFNGGTGRGTLSACFKFDVPDDMGGIMDVAKKAALVLKYGGGVGYALSALRPAGSPINTTHKVSSGPIGFMPIYQALAMSITQGGVRQAAQMAILHCDHPDIKEFIDLKSTIDKANQFNTFNISVAATDEWMRNNPELLSRMAENAWVTGDPGLYFYDQAQRTNPTPWLGPLTGTNPCGEVPLLDNEPCNLGSINLVNHLKHTDGAWLVGTSPWEFDWDKLERTTRLATRYLDDTLDNNTFPHEDITNAALLTRKLGLGIMGWADALALMHIHYDTDEAVVLGENLMRSINDWAEDESHKLAVEKGCAPCYTMMDANHKWDLRNATRTCIAPTGTIAILAGVSSGIEPHFSGEWQRKTHEGIILDESAIKVDGFTPKTAMEIDWHWHIKHQAAFQRHTDLAVSKTINMANDVTPKDIYDAYVFAWEKGCKGVTIFRDGSRGGQVLTTTTTKDTKHNANLGTISGENPNSSNNGQTAPISGDSAEGLRTIPKTDRQHLSKTRNAITHKFSIDGQDVYFTVGLYDDDTPGELFIKASKEGSTISGLLDGIGIAVSLGLQHGVPMSVYARKYAGVNFEPHGLTDNPDIRTATSVLDYIFRWLGHRFNGHYHNHTGVTYDTVNMSPMYDSGQRDDDLEIIPLGNFCPECESPTVMQEGCQHCTRCDWSRC